MQRTTTLLFALSLLLPALPAAAQKGFSVQSDGDQKLYSIDLQTGAATAIGETGFDGIEGLAFSPGCQTLYGVDDVSDRLVTCNTGTGACQSIGSLGVDVTDTGLAFANDGALYMSTDAPKRPSIKLYQIDPATGVATLVGDQGREVTGLAGNLTGVFGLGGDGTNSLVSIDPVSGAATKIGDLATVSLQDGGSDFGRDGTFWGINDVSGGGNRPSGPSQIFKVDLKTGRATVVATARDGSNRGLNGFEGLAIQDGICGFPGFGNAVATETPTLDEWAMIALAGLLGALGYRVLRQG